MRAVADRLSRYDAAFRATETRYNLPVGLLKAVARTESGGDPNARSSAGAVGLMQFIPSTGRAYGLYPGGRDVRTNPVLSIQAAGKYLSDLYGSFGNLPEAIAAYNAGEGRVRSGRQWPAETQAYVPKVLAAMGLPYKGQPSREGYEEKGLLRSPRELGGGSGPVPAEAIEGAFEGFELWNPATWGRALDALQGAAGPLIIIILIGVALVMVGFKGLV